MEQLKSVRDLQRGDIVRNKGGDGSAYVVNHLMQGPAGSARAVAVTAIEVTNPAEWLVMRTAIPEAGTVEVERLRAELAQARNDHASVVACLAETERERDAANAEADRLHAILAASDRSLATSWNRGFSFRGAEVIALQDDLKAARLDHERAVAATAEALRWRNEANAKVARMRAIDAHEVTWLKSLLAEERARADRAEASARRRIAQSITATGDATMRSEVAEDLAAVRLQEILRLRREREEIRSRGWTDEMLAKWCAASDAGPVLYSVTECADAAEQPDTCPGSDVVLYGIGYTCGKCGARGRLVEGPNGETRIAPHRPGVDARFSASTFGEKWR